MLIFSIHQIEQSDLSVLNSAEESCHRHGSGNQRPRVRLTGRPVGYVVLKVVDKGTFVGYRIVRLKRL